MLFRVIAFSERISEDREVNKLGNGDMYLFFHSVRELLKKDQMSLYCFYPRKKLKNETVDYKNE